MKFIALIRQVPDSESRLKIAAGQVDLSGATLVLDQMDEYGVEEALRLREAHGGEAVAVALGPDQAEEALRTALAMGMDRAIHLVFPGYLDPVGQANALAPILAEEQPTLILTGGQQADWDSQALGGCLAQALGWPLITWTTQLEVSGNSAIARHDLDEGAQRVRVNLPAVFTTQQGLNEPRYPTLPGIMKAKRKEIRRHDLEASSRVEILDQTIQERTRLGKIIDGTTDPQTAAHQLVELLHHEAKVIG